MCIDSVTLVLHPSNFPLQGFELDSHFQTLTNPSIAYPHGIPEAFPWTLSAECNPSSKLGHCAGACNFFGGKSIFWYGWTPQPGPSQMRAFPQSMLDSASDPIFWPRANKLLNTTRADQIHGIFFDDLQDTLGTILGKISSRIPPVSFSGPAFFSLARDCETGSFTRFSAPRLLTQLLESKRRDAKVNSHEGAFDVILNCAATKLLCQNAGRRVYSIDTEKGQLTWTDTKTKIVLCGGVSSPALLVWIRLIVHRHYRTQRFF